MKTIAWSSCKRFITSSSRDKTNRIRDTDDYPTEPITGRVAKTCETTMPKPSKKQLKSWVNEIRCNPSAAFHKQRFKPRSELAKHGSAALPLLFEGMCGTREVVEAMATVLHEIAKVDPRPLIEALENDAAPADPHLWLVVDSLGSVRKKSLAVDSLIAALKHKNQYVRNGAVDALVRLRSKKAILPLIETILDRSGTVRFSIVTAINTTDFFRDARAIPNLKRLLKKKNLDPGTRKHAQEALKRLEEESRGEEVSHVNYSWTNFNDAQMIQLPEMPQLRSMDLSDTHVSDAGLKELKRFPELRALDLNNTDVTATGMRHLKVLKMLESLKIGGVGFDGKAGLVHLAHLPNLSELDLNGTSVRDSELRHLKDFKALASLRLFLSTGDIGLEFVSSVRTLESLALFHSPISDAGVAHLTKLRKLRRLSIRNCRITDASCKSLEKLRKLKSLVLGGTELSEIGIESLRGALPNCEIKT